MHHPHRSIAPGFLLGFALALLVIAATLAVGLGALRVVAATTNAVGQASAAKSALKQMLATLVDAETGQRGFIITGDERYLEPYETGHAAMPTSLTEVRALISDRPAQLEDLTRVSVLTGIKFHELGEVIELRREHGFDQAQSLVATNAGKHTMDQLRAIVAGMTAREDDTLSARTADAARVIAPRSWH